MTATIKRANYGNRRGWTDNGERYYIAYRDGTGRQCKYGFTNDLEEARKWIAEVKANPMWSQAGIRDREAKVGS